MKKYSLTKNTREWFGRTLFQIKAEISFGNVKKGELGGYIEKEENLSQEGNAWVSGNARVSDNAQVSGNAQVYGNAQVSGDALVYGDAQVSGDALVYGDARVCGDALVYGDARVCGDARVYDDARVCGNARVYDDARVCGNARVYGDAQVCAKASFTKGKFIGGSDSDKITNITEQTGSTFWKNQYVLGDYEIIPIKEKKEESLIGQEVSVTIGDKTYKAVIKD